MFIFLSFSVWTFFFYFLNFVNCHSSNSRIGHSISGAEINFQFEEESSGLQEKGEVGLEKRQACGAGVGSCPTGQCCSIGGQCGTGHAFCDGPSCQLAYGPACDGNISPPGASTANIPRPNVGNVPYGAGLYHCTTPGVVALTFDDGPCNFTTMVLATLAKYNVSATFFINGNSLGKGRIDDPNTPWPQILKNMHAAGHQLASHTWTHQDLTNLPVNLMQNQVVYNEMAFRNIFGFIPTYIRPPFGYCFGSSTCSSYLSSMGYHIILWDVDTKDYLNDDPKMILNSQNYFAGNTSNPASGHSYIPLAHDIHLNTAQTLVAYMLDTLKVRGYKAVTVGECMGDPRVNWYRDAGRVPYSSSSTVGSNLAPATIQATAVKATSASTVESENKSANTVASTNKALSPNAQTSSTSKGAGPGTTSNAVVASTTSPVSKSGGSRTQLLWWCCSIIVLLLSLFEQVI